MRSLKLEHALEPGLSPLANLSLIRLSEPTQSTPYPSNMKLRESRSAPRRARVPLFTGPVAFLRR
jgi:hypothetical protein